MRSRSCEERDGSVSPWGVVVSGRVGMVVDVYCSPRALSVSRYSQCGHQAETSSRHRIDKAARLIKARLVNRTDRWGVHWIDDGKVVNGAGSSAAEKARARKAGKKRMLSRADLKRHIRQMFSLNKGIPLGVNSDLPPSMIPLQSDTLRIQNRRRAERSSAQCSAVRRRSLEGDGKDHRDQAGLRADNLSS